MSGGLPRPASRLSTPLLPGALAALVLSGCALFHGQQPAPITDALVSTVEPASEPVAASEPETDEPETAGHETPRKPKHPAVKPRKPEPPPPVAASAPVAPPPAPIITTRLIDRSQTHALLDSEVQRRDGKVIGRAVDLVADAGGKPNEMIVNLQGFLGIGDRKVSFPWSVFRFTPGGHGSPITLDVPVGKLPPADRPKRTGADVPVTATQLPLLDTTVERPNGAAVGRVVDVLIDGSAQPQAVVLDVSGMVSPDRRTIAANWSALRFVTKDKLLHALLDLNDAQIKASPPYASDKPIQAVSPVVPVAAAPASTAPPVAPPAAASPARASR
ncbi:PRC-barrel domain-containing protein [Paraburkholderia acidicola]|uniref:PRC-barrel domain-containing protein n=1 Tax=Paraburkholderia acidicola TaxID=1912599 RepID=A0ABV1LFA4_9BURK